MIPTKGLAVYTHFLRSYTRFPTTIGIVLPKYMANRIQKFDSTLKAAYDQQIDWTHLPEDYKKVSPYFYMHFHLLDFQFPVL